MTTDTCRIDPAPALHTADFYLGDVHATYRRLRRRAPVYWHAVAGARGGGVFALSRHADIRFVSKRPDLFSTSSGVLLNDLLPRAGTKRASHVPPTESLIHMDPPRHGRIRALVRQAFTPRQVGALEDWMRGLCRERFSKLSGTGEVDLVSEVAAPIPAIALARIVGIPEQRWRHFQRCADAMIALTAGDPAAPPPTGHAALLGELARDLRERVARRREEPGDDLISGLVSARAEQERFGDDDIVMMALMLIGAGNETTRTLISGACLALCQHPVQREQLIEEPERMGDAVEEFLRWVTPVHSHIRTARRDCEVGGERIGAGDAVVLLYASGNRDEEVWDDPERFDPLRPRHANPHLALGHGEHFCLGASLARLETRVVFEELLARFPRLSLAGPVRRQRSTHINGIASMPVRLGG